VRTEAAIVQWRSEHAQLPIEDLFSLTGVHPATLDKFGSFGLLEPECESLGHPLFSPAVVPRLRCAARLRDDLGVNLAGIAVILDMRERIEALQAELKRLREELEGRTSG
jgi:DNA-binding transcriptional MerR regulator